MRWRRWNSWLNEIKERYERENIRRNKENERKGIQDTARDRREGHKREMVLQVKTHSEGWRVVKKIFR